jgi:hypothetical protein
MSRIILACAIAAIFAMPAKADETVKWRHVQHTASVQTLQVGDVNGHILGLFRLPGIAFFPDGSTGKTVVIGTNDSVAGSDGSMANGYYTLIFNDGSALWFKYTGTVKSGVISGTGIVIYSATIWVRILTTSDAKETVGSESSLCRRVSLATIL